MRNPGHSPTAPSVVPVHNAIHPTSFFLTSCTCVLPFIVVDLRSPPTKGINVAGILGGGHATSRARSYRTSKMVMAKVSAAILACRSDRCLPLCVGATWRASVHTYSWVLQVTKPPSRSVARQDTPTSDSSATGCVVGAYIPVLRHTLGRYPFRTSPP